MRLEPVNFSPLRFIVCVFDQRNPFQFPLATAPILLIQVLPDMHTHPFGNGLDLAYVANDIFFTHNKDRSFWCFVGV
jgi:hypothetical protein